jgi:hypothetical protein
LPLLVFSGTERLDGSATGDEVDDEHNQRNDQQQVNKVSGESTNRTDQPKNEQDYKNRPQHSFSPF